MTDTDFNQFKEFINSLNGKTNLVAIHIVTKNGNKIWLTPKIDCVIKDSKVLGVSIENIETLIADSITFDGSKLEYQY